MKLLWVSDEDNFKTALASFWNRYNLDLIHYSNARKAIDNLDEIDPHILIFNALDFPRHWPLAARLIRERKNYKEMIMILLKGNHFTHENGMKASWLGINGLINVSSIERGDSEALEELLQRYIPLSSLFKQTENSGELVFLTPDENRLCSGTIQFMDSSMAVFRPHDPLSILTCREGQVIHKGSVKYKSGIETMDFIIRSTKGWLMLEKMQEKNIDSDHSLKLQSIHN